MAIAPKLGDGESFVAGRSTAKARELIEAAEALGLPSGSVVTTSHGYIVPSDLLDGEGDDPRLPDPAPVERPSADVDNEPAEYDPSKERVEEVLAYLDGADEEEVQRVLAAEAEGKGRSTILAYTPEGE